MVGLGHSSSAAVASVGMQILHVIDCIVFDTEEHDILRGESGERRGFKGDCLDTLVLT